MGTLKLEILIIVDLRVENSLLSPKGSKQPDGRKNVVSLAQLEVGCAE